MLRNIGATIFGLIVGMCWNMGLILVNSLVIFPMPEGMKTMEDPEQMKAYIASLPMHAFILVLVAHAGQAGIGGWIAARLGHSRPVLLAWIIGVATLFGAVQTQLDLAGPAWMWVDLPLIAAATWFAGSVETKRRATLA